MVKPRLRFESLGGAVFKFMKENEERLDSVILYDRDFSYDFFAFKVRAPCLSWRHREA